MQTLSGYLFINVSLLVTREPVLSSILVQQYLHASTSLNDTLLKTFSHQEKRQSRGAHKGEDILEYFILNNSREWEEAFPQQPLLQLWTETRGLNI